MEFTHLHVHTGYSLLDGAAKIKELVHRAKELGYDSLAITDHGVMYGVIEFYEACMAEGIKPILGCEVYVSPGSRFDREVGKGDERYYHLVLLAETDQGYHNLSKIVTRGFTEGFYYKPRVDMEVLEKYHEGIIALSACLAGEVATHLRKNDYDGARDAAIKYRNIFGEDNYFLEMQDHGIPDQATVNAGVMRLSKELGIPMVVTNDSHYIYAEDWEAHDVLLCIQTNRKVQDENRMRYDGGQYYLKSKEEMAELFPYATEALENTHKIAERCNVKIVFGEQKVPKFDVPDGYTAEEYLEKLVYDGMNKKYGIKYEDTEDLKEGEKGYDVRQRIDYELSVIKSMGFVDYFLIVWDFIHFAKTNGIAVGPGRGSAVGSVVAYCLDITTIEPLQYDLLFERFLNPERVSMPDIDIDFCYIRRQEVIDYCVKKYGEECVTQIIAYQTMGARNVIRDVGRAMDIPYAQCDALAKAIPAEKDMTIDIALKTSKDFQDMYNGSDEIRKLVNIAKKLEGLPRNASTHASGVVICQRPADDFVPLSRGTEGAIVTQFEKDTVEQLGLLKMDFLGLRNLTIIEDACKLIGMSTGTEVDIDRIDYNEKEVYESLWTGRTDGVFQLESNGMKSFMKELKPQNMEDVIAGISLYRPGPMDFIPKYIHGKNNRDEVTYTCPELKPILEPTYGCIVYQEQVMQIVRDLGGYTLGRSDLVRRAMSKKKSSVMEQERKNFVYGNKEENVPGCVAKGISVEVAEHIFGEMMDFAKYAFNKSHAACYAVVAYQTAWLKYHYPVEYMAALLTSVIDEAKKISAYIMTCKNMGIEILPPDVNEGLVGFSVKDGAIIYALTAIKGVGNQVVDVIVREREKNGPYKTLQDFISRLIDQDINKRLVENFIKAGAFDTLPGNRAQKMNIYGPIMDNIQRNQKNNLAGQLSLFDFADEEQKQEFDIRMPDIPEFKKEVLLNFEKEVTGFYVSGHPLDEYKDFWKKRISATTAEFAYNDELDEGQEQNQIADGIKATIGGLIAGKTVKYTKNNKIMAFLTIEDLAGSVEVIVFPRQYEMYGSKLAEEAKVFVTGRTNVEDEKDGKLILESVVAFDDAQKKLWIKFASIDAYEKDRAKLEEIMKESEGRDMVTIYCEKEKMIKELPPNCNVKADDVLIENLKAVFGEENIRLV